MTISSLITAKQYTSNGATTQYAFPNKIFAATDLVVTLIDLVGNLYPFTNFANAGLGLSYSVQGVDVDTGCTVVFSGVQTSGWTVDIRTVTADTQSTSIKNQGQFLPELHEEAFDRATRQIQDLLRQTYTYGIHGPDIETTPWPALPGASVRAGFSLVFDTNGLPALGTAASAGTITGTIIANLLNLITGIPPTADKVRTAAEIAAGVTPTNYAYAPYDARRYGADPTFTNDSTAALNAWISVVLQATIGSFAGQSFKGGYLPGGAYKVSGALTPITVGHLRLYGDGSDVSRIVVNGGSSSFTVLTLGVARPSSTVTQSIQIEGIGIFRNSGSGAITLMMITGTQYCHYRDITLYDNSGTTGGVGLNYAGHENNTFESFLIVNVQPIILANPSGNNNDGCDHTVFLNTELQSSNDTQALITVTGANTGLSNFKFIGTQVWLGGVYGFLWNNTGSGSSLAVCGDLLFENIRREQTSGLSVNESIYIRLGGSSGGGTNDTGTNLSVRNCTFGLATTGTGGMYFEGPRYVTLENINLSVAGVGVKMVGRTNDNSVQLVTINCNLDQAASTFTNMEKVFGSSDGVLSGTNPNPQTCIYQYADVNNQNTRGMRLYEGRKWLGKRAAVANGGGFNLPGSTTSVGICTIAASVGSGSIEGGTIICSGSATALVTGTANVTAGILAGKLSVTWNGGSASYIVTNNLGSARDITVSMEWM